MIILADGPTCATKHKYTTVLSQKLGLQLIQWDEVKERVMLEHTNVYQHELDQLVKVKIQNLVGERGGIVDAVGQNLDVPHKKILFYVCLKRIMKHGVNSVREVLEQFARTYCAVPKENSLGHVRREDIWELAQIGKSEFWNQDVMSDFCQTVCQALGGDGESMAIGIRGKYDCVVGCKHAPVETAHRISNHLDLIKFPKFIYHGSHKTQDKLKPHTCSITGQKVVFASATEWMAILYAGQDGKKPWTQADISVTWKHKKSKL